MAARSIGSGTLSIGHVAIPVKLYTATSAKGVSFNQLHACPDGTYSRTKQQLLCAAEDKPVERGELVKGLEFAIDQYAIFTAEELKSLEASRPAVLELVEFVPARSVDPIHVEKTVFLGPDNGGAHGYALLADALRETKRVGIGSFAGRSGKDVLVELRPYGAAGLALHELFYADEVRSFDDIPTAALELGARERRLVRSLITKMAGKAFEPARYRDTWAEKVIALAKEKAASGTLEIPATPDAREQLPDLVDALERSVAASGPRKTTGRRGARAA